jgi:hypothetical protein
VRWSDRRCLSQEIELWRLWVSCEDTRGLVVSWSGWPQVHMSITTASLCYAIPISGPENISVVLRV